MVLRFIYTDRIFKHGTFFDALVQKAKKDAFFKSSDKFCRLVQLSHLFMVDGMSHYLFDEFLESSHSFMKLQPNVRNVTLHKASMEKLSEDLVRFYTLTDKLTCKPDYSRREFNERCVQIFRNYTKVITSSGDKFCSSTSSNNLLDYWKNGIKTGEIGAELVNSLFCYLIPATQSYTTVI